MELWRGWKSSLYLHDHCGKLPVTATTYPKGFTYMFGFGVSTSSYYEVLGVTTASTMEEIKKQYRLLAHKYHLDKHESEEAKAENAALFRKVQEAWEWLDVNHVQTEVTPEAGEVIISVAPSSIDGFPVQIVIKDVTAAHGYHHNAYYTVQKTCVVMSLAVAYSLHDIEKINFPDQTKIDMVQIVEKGEILFSCDVYGNRLYGFDKLIRAYERKLILKEYQATLERIVQTQQAFDRLGIPTNRLRKETINLRALVNSYSYGWSRQELVPNIVSQIKICENEIERIKDGGTHLLVDGLLDGSIYHEDMKSIQETIDAIKIASIRSNGFIEPFNETLLRQHIEERLNGLEDVNRLMYVGLRLKLSDYLPYDVMSELEDSGLLAPATIQLQSRKGLVGYDVAYSEIEVDGEPIKVGMITIPLSVYEKNASEYGKPSKFPVLPFGVRLYLRITNDNKPVADGFATDTDRDLEKKIAKYNKWRNKSRPSSKSNLYMYDERPYFRTYDDPNRQRYNARIKW